MRLSPRISQAGVGLRLPHLAEVAAARPAADWLEIHPENFLANSHASELLTEISAPWSRPRTCASRACFDRPCTAMLGDQSLDHRHAVALQTQIEGLLLQRDHVLAKWDRAHPGRSVLDDEDLEITSSTPIDIDDQIARVAEARRSAARIRKIRKNGPGSP